MFSRLPPTDSSIESPLISNDNHKDLSPQHRCAVTMSRASPLRFFIVSCSWMGYEHPLNPLLSARLKSRTETLLCSAVGGRVTN